MWPESILSVNTDHCGSVAASPTLIRRITGLCIGFPPILCLIFFGLHSSFLDHTSKLNHSHTKLWESGNPGTDIGYQKWPQWGIPCTGPSRLLQVAEFHYFYGWKIFHCLSIYLSHIVFIHSSVDGYLGCFHILAVVSNAALITGVQVWNILCSDCISVIILVVYIVYIVLWFCKMFPLGKQDKEHLGSFCNIS